MHAITVAYISALCHCSAYSYSPVESTTVHLLSPWHSVPFCHLTLAQMHFPWEVACGGPWQTLITHHPGNMSSMRNVSIQVFLSSGLSCNYHFLSPSTSYFLWWVWNVFKRLGRVLKGSCCFGPKADSQVFPGVFPEAPAIECLQGPPSKMYFWKSELKLESL